MSTCVSRGRFYTGSRLIVGACDVIVFVTNDDVNATAVDRTTYVYLRRACPPPLHVIVLRGDIGAVLVRVG